MDDFNPEEYLLESIKKARNPQKNKLNYYMKTTIYNVVDTIIAMLKRPLQWTRNDKFDELYSVAKDIFLYGIIGYPAYHLMFVRSNIVLTIIGCGSLYYLFRDSFDFLITTIAKIPRGYVKK